VAGIFIEILAILVAANSLPVLLARLLGPRGAQPVDGGWKPPDGQPLFGRSKTWRGVIAMLAGSALTAFALGYSAGFGLVFGALVAAGDLLSSFVKRRRRLTSSARATGLDQLPESLLPSLYATCHLGIDWWWAPLWAAVFMLLAMVISPLLFLLRIRKRPY
jgi:CDP-2,3-bis-(O-geranylgeranyl)-sn-glycerol synthase